jgi:hypothetical protein
VSSEFYIQNWSEGEIQVSLRSSVPLALLLLYNSKFIYGLCYLLYRVNTLNVIQHYINVDSYRKIMHITKVRVYKDPDTNLVICAHKCFDEKNNMIGIIIQIKKAEPIAYNIMRNGSFQKQECLKIISLRGVRLV